MLRGYYNFWLFGSFCFNKSRGQAFGVEASFNLHAVHYSLFHLLPNGFVSDGEIKLRWNVDIFACKGKITSNVNLRKFSLL